MRKIAVHNLARCSRTLVPSFSFKVKLCLLSHLWLNGSQCSTVVSQGSQCLTAMWSASYFNHPTEKTCFSSHVGLCITPPSNRLPGQFYIIYLYDYKSSVGSSTVDYTVYCIHTLLVTSTSTTLLCIAFSFLQLMGASLNYIHD